VEDTWEKWWHDRTGKGVTLCSVLSEDCAHAEVRLTGLDLPEVDVGQSGKQKIVVHADVATVKNAKLTLSLSGLGAEHAKLKQSEFDIGEMAADSEKEFEVQFDVDDRYSCATSFVIDAKVESDNAKTAHQTYRVLPGYKIHKEITFAKDAVGFKVNSDGKDKAGDADGALAYASVEMSCDMTPRTAERDNSPDDTGAFVTQRDLNGDTSLWSPEIDLGDDAVDPEVRYAYWLDGTGSLTAQISRDGGDTFKTADVFKEPGHSWAQGTANLHELFGDELPASVVVRFIFNGNGKLAGGIDDFRVVDVEGVCLEQNKWAGAHCGCSVDGSAGPQASLAVLAGLLGLRALRRRRSA
jgi:MYXO-CTERM domain-containing protein